MKNYRVGEHFDESFTKLPPEHIKDNLDAMCYSKDNRSYTKPLNDEELSSKKSRLAEVSIQLSEIETKRKEYMAEIKALKVEPVEEKNELIEIIKHKSQRLSGIVWNVDDPDQNLMYCFDENGICVDKRLMEPSERQAKLRMLNQEKLSNE